MNYLLPLLLCFLVLGCQSDAEKIKRLGQLSAFMEMVAAEVKPIALSAPMTPSELDEIWEEATRMAEEAGVELYREPSLIRTLLFPTGAGADREVLLVYKGNALAAYLDLKEHQEQLEEEQVARRFGRLLGYPTTYVNTLLATNSSFRSLPDFGIQGTNIFLYYEDLPAAEQFYGELLGLEKVSDYGFAQTFRIAQDAFLTLVDATIGRHQSDEPKTVAIALLTDALPDWYTYLQAEGVEIKYPYKPKEGAAHDGFVVVDPEGYLLEFETFKQHPENEVLLPQLRRYAPLELHSVGSTSRKGFYGAVYWMYYEDLQEAALFYTETIGLPLRVDQGWAHVYQASETGYIGLVDERRGMHRFTEKKGASMALLVADWEAGMRMCRLPLLSRCIKISM
ncbi:glyoxalase/bleomycin resistance protein/dioxygenase [Nitritalea halalkaliphila LW7]|uniref:Glyoxalase/bleomycin resistance protein/dioxygenase n=1 Tax=Nitritalea halalkaliphila LW7 TaxID=1189621 RepID=I5C3L3_9BACT|nr:VOC family protein [Nitritalea halalkaliphila]EIM76415.1 glyoxalase/bleomycin resistance protein/dioxygenase [Nitritalea halalkaliphila LW7]